MKKILLLALMAVAIFASCNDEFPRTAEGKGAIKIESVTLGGATRAEADLTVVLTLPGGSTQTMAMPGDGIIPNLDPGDYKVYITTHRDGMPLPAFDNPYYAGAVEGVKVVANKTTPVNVNCPQLNGSLYFEYGAGFADVNIVPTLTDENDKSLEYKEKTTDKGYFAPGKITLTATIDGSPAEFNDDVDTVFDLEAAMQIKITLSMDDLGEAKLKVEVTFEEINIDEESWEVVPDVYDEGVSNLTGDVEMPAMAGDGMAEGLDVGGIVNYWSMVLYDVGRMGLPDRQVQFEFWAEPGDMQDIPDGRYEMAVNPDEGEINTTEPGNIYGDRDWGCWYYADEGEGEYTSRASLVGGRGYMELERTSGTGEDAEYHIEFEFFDTNGYKVSGVFDGWVFNFSAGTRASGAVPQTFFESKVRDAATTAAFRARNAARR